MNLAIKCSIVCVVLIVKLSILSFMIILAGIGVVTLAEAVVNHPVSLIAVTISIGVTIFSSYRSTIDY